MSSGEGHIPPSEGRIAAAYRDGRFPRSGLLATGVSLLLTSGVLFWWGGPVSLAVLDLFHQGVSGVSTRPEGAEGMLSIFTRAAWIIVPFLGLVVVGSVVSTALPALIARRKRGRTAVPLPPQKQARLSLFGLRSFGAIVFVLISFLIIRELPFPEADADAVLMALGRGVCRMIAAAGGILVLLGISEFALLRHAVWRSLFLDSSESRREQRAREGDPRIKRERRSRPRRVAQ